MSKSGFQWAHYKALKEEAPKLKCKIKTLEADVEKVAFTSKVKGFRIFMTGALAAGVLGMFGFDAVIPLTIGFFGCLFAVLCEGDDDDK